MDARHEYLKFKYVMTAIADAEYALGILTKGPDTSLSSKLCEEFVKLENAAFEIEHLLSQKIWDELQDNRMQGEKS